MEKLKGYTSSMIRLVEEFEKLPGIGRKTAERLAYHVLTSPKEEMMRLADALREVKENVKSCEVCNNIAEGSPCDICSDPRREHSLVCVVEQPRDLIALETTGNYKGLYHVLGGRISPLEGIDPEDLAIQRLVQRVKGGEVREVILATNPNLEGDGTALFIQKLLAPLGVKTTRLARGLASGGYIEHANPVMLSDALSGREEF